MPALGQSAPIAKPFVRYSDKLKAGDSVKASDEGGGGIHHHTRMFETLGDKARRLYAEWCAEGLAPDEIEARLDHEPKGWRLSFGTFWRWIASATMNSMKGLK